MSVINYLRISGDDPMAYYRNSLGSTNPTPESIHGKSIQEPQMIEKYLKDHPLFRLPKGLLVKVNAQLHNISNSSYGPFREVSNWPSVMLAFKMALSSSLTLRTNAIDSNAGKFFEDYLSRLDEAINFQEAMDGLRTDFDALSRYMPSSKEMLIYQQSRQSLANSVVSQLEKMDTAASTNVNKRTFKYAGGWRGKPVGHAVMSNITVEGNMVYISHINTGLGQENHSRHGVSDAKMLPKVLCFKREDFFEKGLGGAILDTLFKLDIEPHDSEDALKSLYHLASDYQQATHLIPRNIVNENMAYESQGDTQHCVGRAMLADLNAAMAVFVEHGLSRDVIKSVNLELKWIMHHALKQKLDQDMDTMEANQYYDARDLVDGISVDLEQLAVLGQRFQRARYVDEMGPVALPDPSIAPPPKVTETHVDHVINRTQAKLKQQGGDFWWKDLPFDLTPKSEEKVLPQSQSMEIDYEEIRQRQLEKLEQMRERRIQLREELVGTVNKETLRDTSTVNKEAGPYPQSEIDRILGLSQSNPKG